MHFFNKTFSAAIVCISLAACTKDSITGSGSISSDVRNHANFTAIAVEGNTDVEVAEGTAFRVELKAYANLLPYLETKVIGSTLHIGFKSGTNVSNDNSKAIITLPDLKAIRSQGNSDWKLTSGSADLLDIALTGNCNVEAFQFPTKHNKITITGNCQAAVQVSDNLVANITGDGTIMYMGNPTVDTKITGNGRVIKR